MMGDTGLNLLYSLDNSNVSESDVMILDEELDQEEASLLEQEEKASLNGHKLTQFMNINVACQTDFDEYGSSGIPLIFCSMFSPACDAATQCDIPKMVNAAVCTTESQQKPLLRVITLSKNKKEEAEERIKISVPMNKYGNAINAQRAYQKIAPKPSKINAKKISGSPLGTLTVSINKGTNVVTIGSKENLPKASNNFIDTSNNTPLITTFKAEVLSPPPKKKKTESTEEEEESESFSCSDNDDEELVEEEDDDGDDIDDWDESLKKGEKASEKDFNKSDEVDEQLLAVQECLKRMKSEPVDVDEETPIKIPKKARLNLLHSVFHQNIKIEADEEWITDDEVDDDVDEFNITEHLEQIMKDSGHRTCKDCNLTFNSPLLLIEHSEANHVANVCHICGFTTTFKNKLNRHMVKHTKEKSFICEMCGKQYSQKQNLRDHISRNHSQEDAASRYPYNCEHCKRMYRNESNLLKHQSRGGGSCETCGEELPCTGLLFQHKKNHISCSCEYCDKVFQSRSALQIHVNIKHKDKGLQCSMCPKKFLFPSYLKLHFANAHSQSSPRFKCQECGFCAVTESYLKSHRTRMHSSSQKKNYLCQVCNKNFRSNARLVEHTRIHTGERPFACPVCFKTFYSQSNLYSHERTVHGRLKNYGSKDPAPAVSNTGVMKKVFSSCYQCQHCSATFNNKKKLKAHMASAHNIGEEENSRDGENGLSNHFDHLEVDEAPFEIDGETALQHANAKDDIDPVERNDDLSARSALSLPAYVVPPNVNLVEIDGVQYHVIRSNS